MYFIYTLILTLGIALTFPYYLFRFRKYLPTLADRLGFLKIPQLRRSVWVHAVSVGEVKAVETLLERLRQQFPGKPVVVSTATPSGQQLARQRHDIVDHAFYFPIDLPWCVRRAVNRVDPQMVIIAETEIWPNFLRCCRRRGARVVMINGRISDRSFVRYRLARRWLRRVFEDYTIIGMQSEMDRERMEAIGANPRKVTVFGNLKYDAVASTRNVDDQLSNYLKDWKLLWIAASTMPGEEKLVLDAFKRVLQTEPSLKLLIAPRHADRFDTVAEIIKNSGFELLRRTQLQPAEGSNAGMLRERILLLDTIGELSTVFQYAAVVYMGGSLVPTGGHNVLEPARYGKPIVFGPHMENFRDIARLLLDAKAAVQIQNQIELAPAISRILSNPQHALELGRNAFAVVQRNTGATERVLQVLEPAEARQ
jgi:3-deoxy-D-manno-octulosonic-acid transferase